MQHHPDRQFAEHIITGIAQGFRIGFQYTSHARSTAKANHPSANEHPDIISCSLDTEIQKGRLLGPLHPSIHSLIHTSSLGAIPKKHSDKWRLILDLSHPAGHSINDGIEKPACSLSYIIVDEVVQKVLLPGRGCQLAKIDIESAFRNVPVHPQDRHILALSWNGNIFIEALALDLHQRSLMPWQMLSNGSRSEAAFPTSDILWWHTFSDDWNGLSMMQHSRCQHPDIFLTSDASGSWDCGAYYGTHWLQYPWSPLTKEYNITATELLPMHHRAWGSSLGGKMGK